MNDYIIYVIALCVITLLLNIINLYMLIQGFDLLENTIKKVNRKEIN